MNENDNWKIKALLLGAGLGALTGVGAAYLLVKRSEGSDTQPKLSAREGISLGLLILGMLRQVAQLGADD